MQERIRWSAEEKRAVATRAVNIKAEEPDMAFASLFKEAQLVLPKDRHRVIAGVHAVTWLFPMMARIRLEAPLKKTEHKHTHKHEPVVAPVVQKSEEQAELETNMLVQALASQILAKLPELLSEKLKDELADRVLEKLGQRLLGNAFAVQAPAPVATEVAVSSWVAPEIKEEKPCAKSVLVVGASRKQEAELVEEFGEMLTLNFWRAGEYHRLKDMVKKSSLVVLLSDQTDRKIRFSVDQAVNKHIVLKKIHSDVTNPRDVLEEYYCAVV